MSLLLGGLGTGGGGCGCCGGAPLGDCAPCARCAIPRKDLTLTLGLGGPTFAALWNGVPGSDFWKTLCTTPTPNTVTGARAPFCVGTQDKWFALVQCTNGLPSLAISIGQNSTNPCPDVTMCYQCISPSGLDLIDYTCVPFHMHFRSNGFVGGATSDCPKVTTVLGVTDFYLDDFTATNCATAATINISGCNGLPLPWASVAVVVSGVTIASGTTDGFGNFSFTGGAASATVTISAPRFDTLTSPGQYLPDAAVTSFSLTQSAGYECIPTCGYPEPDALHATHPVFGAVAYNWDGSLWVGTKAYSYPGHVGGSTCAAKVVTITCNWDGGTNYWETWPIDGSGCPDNAGAGGTATAVWTQGTVICYKPSISAFDAPWSFTPSSTAEMNMYGTAALALDLME